MTRRRFVHLTVETLEERQLLSGNVIVHHGGFVQHTGTVEAIFYGPGWSTYERNTAAAIQSGLHGFIDASSTGPNAYLTTLAHAGYGDFNLSLTGGTSTSSSARASVPGTVTTQDVENYLTNALNHPYTATQQADRVDADSATRIYLVVVDPDFAVQDYNGAVVPGYHRTFSAIVNGRPLDVNYAIVAVPGGAAHNQAISSVLVNSQLDTVTAITARELLDALTNPSGHGWSAEATGTEIGDADAYAYVNNTLVVRPFTKKEAWMLPVQAAAPNGVTFVLDTSGNLWERSAVPTVRTLLVAAQVTKVSDQGIDQYGRAMVDYLTSTGEAYEFHDGAAQPVLLYARRTGTSVPLGNSQGPTVLDAKAGQGVSYVLLSNHTVWEYSDAIRTVDLRTKDVTALDAGTNFQGVNMVDVITSDGKAWEVPDQGTKKHWLKVSNVVQISAGRQGRSAAIDVTGTAWLYEERGGLHKVGLGVAEVASGTDAAGNFVLDLVFAGTYVLAELDYGTAANGHLKPNPVLRSAKHVPVGGSAPVPTLAPGGTISKMRAGVIDMIFADGAYEGTIDGSQQLLGTNVLRAV